MTDTIIISVDGQDEVVIPDPHPHLKNDIQIHGEDGLLVVGEDDRVSARLEKTKETRYIR